MSVLNNTILVVENPNTHECDFIYLFKQKIEKILQAEDSLNISIKVWLFIPDSLKLAFIIMVAGYTNSPGNYDPTSLLDCLKRFVYFIIWTFIYSDSIFFLWQSNIDYEIFV